MGGTASIHDPYSGLVPLFSLLEALNSVDEPARRAMVKALQAVDQKTSYFVLSNGRVDAVARA